MSFFRGGICFLLAFAVLAFGAVEEWAQAVLAVAASILLILWALRALQIGTEEISIPSEIFPLLAFALVVVAQIAFHKTASRYYTRTGLQLLVIYIIVMFLLSQSFTRRSHWRMFMWFLMTLGFFVSILGILQQLTFNGKLYWFRVMHFGGTPFGPYVNRNHFAGFAELVIPISLVPLVLGKVRREKLFLVAILAALPIIALLLSASRGGVVSFVVQMLILFLLLIIRRARTKYVIAGGLVLLTAVMAVSWIGVRELVARFSTMQGLEVTAGKRAAMQRDTFRIFKDHLLFGTGLGTLEMVYPPYDSVYDGKVVNHAHNDYLEALAETGILGGLCCLWFLGLFLVNALRGVADLSNSFGSVLNLSGLIACCGILVHSLVDFNLHIPANALLFFVSAQMAAVRLRPSDPVAEESHSHRRRIGKQ